MYNMPRTSLSTYTKDMNKNKFNSNTKLVGYEIKCQCAKNRVVAIGGRVCGTQGFKSIKGPFTQIKKITNKLN